MIEPREYGRDDLFLRTGVANGTVGESDEPYEITFVYGNTPMVEFKDRKYLYELKDLLLDAYVRYKKFKEENL